jgi:hypothetical protein
MQDEFFGSDDQRTLLRRGRAMAVLLAEDRHYSYYGRTVGLPGPEDGDIDRLAALATAQGSATYGTSRWTRSKPSGPRSWRAVWFR